MPKLEEYLQSVGQSEEGFPDGIFCFNDMIAFELLYLIEKNNLPSTFVVGYDGLQNEIYIPRKITSVAVDKLRMAQSAADMILAKVKGDCSDRLTKTVAVSLSDGVTA
jgi:LacI family transcriptional regulator